MVGPSEELRTRVLPAVLTAFGVTILSAGLLTYTVPVQPASQEPGVSLSPDPSDAVVATPTPLISLPPIGTPEPSTSASPQPTSTPPPKGRVATRVRIRDLGIDLAVVKGNTGYPFCNVAMYLPQLSQPGFNKATYLYAHAREGMFLPLLKTKGYDQRGLMVEVWTSDDWLYRYQITQVRRDQPYTTGLRDPAKAKTEQLWLQTSQGPGRAYGYTQVLAKPIDARPADHDASHPTARPVDCG
jgi:sortase (surface protein transpeptidase)